MNQKLKVILQEIEKVVVGKNENVEKIMMAVLAGGHVLMEDVPGTGKTTTAMTFAKVLGMDTRRVQFTSDTMPSDILGYNEIWAGNLDLSVMELPEALKRKKHHKNTRKNKKTTEPALMNARKLLICVQRRVTGRGIPLWENAMVRKR